MNITARHLLILPSVLLALVLSAHTSSIEIPITPTQLDQQNYKFSVSVNATNNDIAFHVLITAKQADVSSDSEAHLAIVDHLEDAHGSISGTDIKPFKPTIPIAFNKDKRVWTVDFTLPHEALKTPGLCFIFSELAHTPINGKTVAMPSITFYEIKLKDFVKP